MDFKDYSVKKTGKYIFNFGKWVVLSGLTGLIGGLIGTAFHSAIEYVTEMRSQHSWVLYLLPLAGVIIALLYKTTKMEKIGSTDYIISAIRENKKVPFILAPLIFVGTVLTHLFGGSAGREGAALQLGGSIGSFVGRGARLGEKDMHLIIMCGMSSVFSALFGTPLTAAVFSMEVISVGIIYYAGFVPSLTSALVAYYVSSVFKLEPVRFTIKEIPELSFISGGKVVLLAALCGLLSIVFCIVIHQSHKLSEKLIKNSFLRALICGLIIVILTLLVGNYDYNGAGMNIVEKAISGSAVPYAFILKMIFTAITLSGGFRGGEIVPTFFIGATFGCVVGPVLGLPASFSAAIGLISLFCSVVNCPLASVILSIELFGSGSIILFAVACAVSYVLSGYFSIYGTQKIVYSKVKAEFININAW